MKILFLNPHVDAQHKLAQALKAKGIALLLPTTPEEAWQVLGLHASSVDLAIIHREGLKGGDPGIALLAKIKKDPSQSDLPIILTSETWTPDQCASHQKTPMGVNAYLGWPFGEKELSTTIDSIFGQVKAQAEAPAPTLPPPVPKTSTSLEISNLDTKSTQLPAPEAPQADAAKAGGFVLEDPADFLNLEEPSQVGGAIELQLESEPGEPQAPTKVSRVPVPENAVVQPQAQSQPQSQPPSAPPATPPSAPPATPPSAPPATPPSAPLELSSIELFMETGGEAAPLKAEELPPASPVASESLPDSKTNPSLDIDMSEAEPQAASENPGFSHISSDDVPRDSDLEQEMPYLFSKESGTRPGASGSDAVARALVHPVGDAVVPGGVVNSPDIETLKKYLNLREQDVAALSVQLKAARDEVAGFKAQLNAEKSNSEQMQFMITDQKRKIEDFEREKVLALEGLHVELAELKFQNKAKADKAKVLEVQVKEASSEIDRLKERVRSDIRKIRVRERELENKLEISKKDSEAILSSRENKIIELKRKLDLLEFNMDLLQDRYAREKEHSAKLRDKLAKAAQVVRVAEGLLDDPTGASNKPAEGTQAA